MISRIIIYRYLHLLSKIRPGILGLKVVFFGFGRDSGPHDLVESSRAATAAGPSIADLPNLHELSHFHPQRNQSNAYHRVCHQKENGKENGFRMHAYAPSHTVPTNDTNAERQNNEGS